MSRVRVVGGGVAAAVVLWGAASQHCKVTISLLGATLMPREPIRYDMKYWKCFCGDTLGQPDAGLHSPRFSMLL